MPICKHTDAYAMPICKHTDILVRICICFIIPEYVHLWTEELTVSLGNEPHHYDYSILTCKLSTLI